MRAWAVLTVAGLASLSGSAALYAQPQALTDCEGCPEMVQLPAGTFMMGTTVDKELKQGMPKPQTGRSLPVHKVTFRKSFAMGKYPVTVAQFRVFVDESGYKPSESCASQYWNDGHFIYEEVRGISWRSPGFAQTDRHPVVCVNGEDAEAYAAWLSRETGKLYSVPSEAQYEYGLRAGTTTDFFWGTDERSPVACEYSNQPDFAQADVMGSVPRGPQYRFQCNDGYAFTAPVGTYKPNPWGLHDMQGNIWEWTADCMNETYQGAPTDGSAWRTGDCDARPTRGGSFGNAAISAYAAIRAPRNVGYVGHAWGFRVVRND